MIIKGPCQLCGTNLEYDAEQTGQVIECPNCNQQTRLGTRPKPTGKPKRSMAWPVMLILACVLVIALVGFLAYRFADQFATVLGIGGGMVATLVAIVILIFAFLLAVLWLLFPMFVYFDLKAMRRTLEQIRDKN
jgi:uncharacterized paraquat-inducible protein A